MNKFYGYWPGSAQFKEIKFPRRKVKLTNEERFNIAISNQKYPVILVKEEKTLKEYFYKINENRIVEEWFAID